MDALRALFQQKFGQTPTSITPLAQAGSNRAYFRLSDSEGNTAVGVKGRNISENRAFLYLAHHFQNQQLPAPRIFGVSADESTYLQEDLGTCSLYDALQHGRETKGNYNENEITLLRRTIRLLPHLQIKGGFGLDSSRLLPPQQFDRRTVMFDLNYFKYCFLKPTDLPFDEMALEDDFERLTEQLLECRSSRPTFLYRDFQARNIMLVDGHPRIIDFQGGRIGPIHYDVASFLWQASAHYPQALREQLLDVYLDELSTLLPIDRSRFHRELISFVLFRQLQVLGAYGLRGLFERKPYFLHSIPYALDNLRQLFDSDLHKTYPTLSQALARLSSLDFNPFSSPSS